MTVHCLTEAQKTELVALYNNKDFNITELGKKYRVSERSITRVLDEFDIPTPMPRVRGEAYQAMQVLKSYGMNVEQLKAALAAPALTQQNVQMYLNQCSKEHLAELFYISGLAKIAEMTRDMHQKQAAAHAEAS